MKTGQELVAELLEFFQDPSKWCQGAVARDINGKPVGALSPDAVSWDLYGKLCKMNHETDTSFATLHTAYQEVQAKLPPGSRNTDLEYVNDSFSELIDMLTFLNDGVEPGEEDPGV